MRHTRNRRWHEKWTHHPVLKLHHALYTIPIPLWSVASLKKGYADCVNTSSLIKGKSTSVLAPAESPSLLQVPRANVIINSGLASLALAQIKRLKKGVWGRTPGQITPSTAFAASSTDLPLSEACLVLHCLWRHVEVQATLLCEKGTAVQSLHPLNHHILEISTVKAPA